LSRRRKKDTRVRKRKRKQNNDEKIELLRANQRERETNECLPFFLSFSRKTKQNF